MVKKVLRLFLSKIGPSNKIQFFRFGFNPSGSVMDDLKNCFFGTQNLLKHFQAPDIIKALNLNSQDLVLDFGCGSGYMTLEIAKNASHAIGVDINPSIKKINIPVFLEGKLKFYLYDEFVENINIKFDKIILSEVILSVQSTKDLLILLKEKLQPNGKIILVNGLSRFYVRNVIYPSSIWLNMCKFLNSHVPHTYNEYESELCRIFGNKTKKLLSKKDIIETFYKHGYKLSYYIYSPSSLIGFMIELRQFLLFPQMKNSGFFQFICYRIIFSIIKFWPVKYKSGLIAEFSRE